MLLTKDAAIALTIINLSSDIYSSSNKVRVKNISIYCNNKIAPNILFFRTQTLAKSELNFFYRF